jgi:hypothetical protein
MKRKDDYGIQERKCSRCGKNFIIRPEWVYKYAALRFCSYPCYDAHLTEIENKNKKRREKKKNENQT